MKIMLSKLRTLIREVLQEDDQSPTVPAPKSKAEQEFSHDMGGRAWGKPKNSPEQAAMKQNTPAQQKTIAVLNVFRQRGVYAKLSPEERQQLQADVERRIKSMDPGEAMVSTADSIADEVGDQRSN